MGFRVKKENWILTWTSYETQNTSITLWFLVWWLLSRIPSLQWELVFQVLNMDWVHGAWSAYIMQGMKLFPGCFLIRGLVKTLSCCSWLSVLAPADMVGYRSSIKDLVCVSRTVVSGSLQPHGLSMEFFSSNTGVGAISGDLPNPGTESGSPALQANSLPSALPAIKDLSLWELRKWKLSYATIVKWDLPPSPHTHTLESSLILTHSALNFAKKRLSERIFSPSFGEMEMMEMSQQNICVTSKYEFSHLLDYCSLC